MPRNNHCGIRSQRLAQALKTFSFNIRPSFRMVPAGAVAMLFCVLSVTSLASCSHESDSARPGRQIIGEYERFCDSVCSLPYIPFRHLPGIVHRWVTISEELRSSISRDSLCSEVRDIGYPRIPELEGRISKKMHSAVDDRLHSFQDVLAFERDMSLKLVSSRNPFIGEANDFYSASHSQPADTKSPSEQRDQYLRFLENAAAVTIYGFEDVKGILRQEDVLYRAYLKDMMAHSFSDSHRIVNATEKLSGVLSSYASSHPSDTERMVAYMCARTVCRQVICAQQGVSCILEGNVTSLLQATYATTCFTIPLVHFNPILLSCLSMEQEKEMKEVCRRIPRAFSRMRKDGLVVISYPDSLPNMIMKDYIDFLMRN